MHFSRIFIERPIMTTLVTFAILLFGIVGFRALPIAALPSVDYPTIQVTAFQPGANPETMASSIATPLEREISTIAGVRSISSSHTRCGSAGHPICDRAGCAATNAAAALVYETESLRTTDSLFLAWLRDTPALHG